MWKVSTGKRTGGAERPESASSADWPARATAAVESVVALVRDYSIRPLTLVARALVYGLVIVALATVLAVLIAAALVKVLDAYVVGGRVWAADLLLGAVFVSAGGILWSRRRLTDAGG